MAYRYNRRNWQNKPNVATPISAENLNKMEKGIDDNDKAIGDLVQLNTLNKSSLVSAVNELNNNLAVQNVLDKIIPNSGITFSTASYAKRIGNRISIYLNVTGYTAQANTLIPIATVDSSIWPASFVVGFGLATDHNAQNNVLVRAVISGGTLSISMPTVQSYTNIWFDYYI